MKKIFTLFAAILFLSLMTAMGQTPGPFYRQFFFNPYLFNPAYAGINNELEVNLAYRQQWVNFKDAPVTAGVNVQFPTSERVALGFSILSDNQVLLRNTNFMGTFAYVVPIATNQSLRFALSGGVGHNKLDLTAEELNSNDPAILNASGNNFYVDGNFGVVYANAGLRVGFALTDIFKSNAFNTESFNEFEFSNLRNRLYSISYRFNVGVMETVSLEPYFLYRQTEDGLQDSWEAAALIYFKDKFWTGGSYNQNNGLALFLGLNVKEKFRFSYSYESPPLNSGFTATSSHELHLGIKLGKKKSKQLGKPATEVMAAVTGVEKTTVPEIEKSLSDPSLPATGNKNPGRFVVGDEPQPKDMETPIEIKEEERTRVVPSVTPAKVEEKPKAVPSITPAKEGEKPNAVPSITPAKEGEKPKETPITPAKEEEIKKPTPKAPAAKPRESFTMSRGHYYVVVGVFGVMSHSMKFTKDMMNKGYAVNVALNPKNNLYYVYIMSTLDHEEAKRIRNEYRWKNIFKEAWIYTME